MDVTSCFFPVATDLKQSSLRQSHRCQDDSGTVHVPYLAKASHEYEKGPAMHVLTCISLPRRNWAPKTQAHPDVTSCFFPVATDLKQSSLRQCHRCQDDSGTVHVPYLAKASHEYEKGPAMHIYIYIYIPHYPSGM